MMLWFGIFQTILFGSAIGFPLNAEYSAYSNLVATAFIGSPERAVRVSLGFHGDDQSFLYDGRSDCPAFIGDCFDPTQSDTYFHIRDCPLSKRMANWGKCTEATDLMSLGVNSMSIGRFRLLSESSVAGPQFREVGGMVSINRRSRFMTGKRLQVCSTYRSKPGIRMIPYDVEKLDRPIAVLDEFDSEWVFETIISGVGSAKIEFDPSNQRMLLPTEIARRLEWLIPVSDGRWMADCSANFDISVGISAGLEIRISTEKLINHRIRSRDRRLCEARVSVASVDRITIGRQLLETIEWIVLDNVANQISVKPLSLNRASGLEDVFVDPQPMIPIVSPDVLASQTLDETEFHIDLQKSQDSLVDGFFLWQNSPSAIELSGESQIRMSIFNFVHILGEMSGGPETPWSHSYSGHWTLSQNPVVYDDGVRISFDASPTGTVVLRYNKYGAKLIILHGGESLRIPFEDLHLPQPFQVAEGMELTDSCLVCLLQIRAGETAQSMRDCAHVYHLDCIRKWLETGTQSCPLCRQPVTRDDPGH